MLGSCVKRGVYGARGNLRSEHIGGLGNEYLGVLRVNVFGILG